MTTGQSVVFSPVTSHLDVDDVVRAIEAEKVLAVTVVGDAMARPLADAFERTSADLSSLAVVANGGAQLTPTAKQRLIDSKPNLMVVDGVGSSDPASAHGIWLSSSQSERNSSRLKPVTWPIKPARS